MDHHPGRAQQGPLDLREAVHRQHRRRDRREHPPPVRRQQAHPRLGELVPDQRGLDREHDQSEGDHRPADPPVLPAAGVSWSSRAASAGAS